MKNALIIASSPRRKGNTDLLSQWSADVAVQKGYLPEIIYLRDLKFSPCIACGACEKDGRCHVKDDLQGIYPKILSAEKLIFAAPIFFQSLGALAKALIDRTQCYWAAHYLLKQKVVEDAALRKNRGLYTLLCGATNMKDTFTCSEKVLKIFASSIEASYVGGTFFPEIDEKGAIEKNSSFRTQLSSDLDLFF